MSYDKRHIPAAILMVTIISLGTACMRHDNKPVEWYRLSADVDTSSTTLAETPGSFANLIIGLGPIHIPKYLDRTQIVIAISEHQYRLSENQRWAEPLDQNISLALLKALPKQLGTERIIAYPWPSGSSIDYQIGLAILEFNVDEHGNSHLIAQWFIKHHDLVIVDKRSVYEAVATTMDYEALITAQSVCLSRLGQDIAAALRLASNAEAFAGQY